MELESLSLAPRHTTWQGEGRLSVGCICLRESSVAQEASTVNSINFVFYTAVVFVYTTQNKSLHVLGNPKGIRKFEACVAQGSLQAMVFVEWEESLVFASLVNVLFFSNWTSVGKMDVLQSILPANSVWRK